MADPQDSEASRDSTAESITGSLKELNLLKNMPDEAVVDLENICRWESYGDGELIFDRTDTSNEVYFIAKGRVRVVGHAKSGQEVAFVDLGVGIHFGELSAFDNAPRSATLYTLEDTLLAVTSGDAFINYTRRYPAVGLRLMMHFVGTIRSLNQRVVGLSTTTVIQRVYNEILQLAEPDPANPSRWIVRPGGSKPRMRDSSSPARPGSSTTLPTPPSPRSRPSGRFIASRWWIARFCVWRTMR